MKLSPEKQRAITLTLMVLWCVVLIMGCRISIAQYQAQVGNGHTAWGFVKSPRGMLWNLFLAILPMLYSSAFVAAMQHKRHLVAAAAFVLWLLFFPNAPYLLTDMLHLVPRDDIPTWLLLSMLLSCAGTGTLLGYASLQNIQGAIEVRFGKATGWTVAILSLLACGLGVYVGRYLRWNSWNALTQPWQLVKHVASDLLQFDANPPALLITIVYSVGLIFGYLTLRAFNPPQRAS